VGQDKENSTEENQMNGKLLTRDSAGWGRKGYASDDVEWRGPRGFRRSARRIEKANFRRDLANGEYA
jgi:hypothetical protein